MPLLTRALAAVGALALGLGGALVVATPAFAASLTVTNLNDTGAGSFRKAVLDSAAAGPDTISFAAGVTGTIVLASNLPTITDDLTIVGPGESVVTVDAPDTVLTLQGTVPNIAVAISGITLTSAGITACGINSDNANVTLTNVTASDFACSGVSVTDGFLTATDVTVENDATGIAFTGTDPAHFLTLTRIHAGGAQFSGVNAVVQGAVATVTDVDANDSGIFGFYLATTVTGSSTISGVQADRAGAIGITVLTDDHSTATITDSSATDSVGQGINLQATDHSSLTALRVTSSRSASTGLWLSATDSSSLSVQSSTIQDTVDNSGVWVDQVAGGASLTITGTTITGNFSNDDGGGIDVNTLKDDGSSLTISDSTISGNASGDFGAGVYLRRIGNGVTSTAKVVIQRTTIDDNTSTAGYGAGVAINEVSAETSGLPTVLIDSSTISNNHTPAGGGGVYVSPNSATTAAVVKLLNSTLSGNGAQSGGAVYIEGPGFGGPSLMTVVISHSTLTKNSANTSGGVETNSGDFDLSVDNSIIADNGTFDLQLSSPYAVTYSLVQRLGAGVVLSTADGNILGVDPLLPALANNGGLTRTHLVAPGNLAYNAGDPTVTGAGLFDQRGQARVFERLDIGAVEWRPALAHTGTELTPGPPLIAFLLLFSGVAMVAFSRLRMVRAVA